MRATLYEGEKVSRRRAMASHTARRASSSRTLHAAISSMVRRHPSHRPVASFIRQMLMHGEGPAFSAGKSILPGHVDDAADALAALHRAYLGHDLLDRLGRKRQAGNVRRDRDRRPRPERVRDRQRLVVEDIQRRTAELSLVDKSNEILVDEDVAAADVDQVRA